MLELKNISKSFGTKVVADHISFSLDRNHLLAILGPSGCGKSTLLNIAAGLVAPDSGEVWLNGQNYTQLAPEKRRAGLMFQDYALLPHLNVWENVAFGLKMQGVAHEAAQQRARAMLAQVGLSAESERSTDTLSGGEQQRVALARALIIEPRLLLLDEPFSSLDNNLRLQLRKQTMTLIRQQNIPSILVTHNPEEAFAMADFIALMREGHFIQFDTPEAVLKRPASEWAARLIGCLNVTPTHYIPQQALHLNHTEGLPSLLKQVLRQPEYCRLIIQHPVYGELLLNLDWPSASNLNVHDNSTWPLYVDKQLIVHFS